MKLDLCIYEASPKLYAWYHGNCICRHDYQLALISIMLLFDILAKAEQKMVARYQTCCTNSTEGTIHESTCKNQQSTTVFLHEAKNLG